MRKELVAAGLVVFIAVWSVWPVFKIPGGIVGQGYDGVLLVWIMNQTIGKLSGGGGGIFTGNIFYPYNNVLAYSDMFVPSAILGYGWVKYLNDPGEIFKAVMLFGQVATMLIVYFWWKEMTGKRWAAVVGTAVLGLSQIRMHYSVHLQMWGMQFWLVGVWLIGKWFKDNKPWKLYLGAGILAIQAWESLLPLYFAVLVLSVKCLVLRPQIVWRQAVVAVILGLAVVLPVANVYRGVAGEFDYQRSIRDAAHFSMGVDELFTKFASPGLYVLLAVAILKAIPLNRGSSPLGAIGENTKWLVAVLISSLVMAMGPVVKWEGRTVKIAGYPIPLPYAAAYYTVPGFGALRTPSRWIWVSAWAASGLIAVGLGRLPINQLAVAGALAVAIIGGTRVGNGVSLPKVSEIPAVYGWLKNQPGETVLELPMYLWDTSLGREEMRMYYSLYHGKKLINGYSGFTPPSVIELAGDMERQLVYKDTDYVVVHKDEMERRKEGKIVYEDEESIVYTGN